MADPIQKTAARRKSATKKKTTSGTKPAPTPRRKQARAIETKAHLLESATTLFSTKGFDGTSVREIEEQAKAQRGLLAYHFGNKQDLWREVVDRLFGGLLAEITRHADVLSDISQKEAAPALLRAFVRYSAKHPELNRLVLQESVADGWRIKYFIENHIAPMLAKIGGFDLTSRQTREESACLYYMIIGAGAFIFSAEHECESLFGFNPREEAFVEKYACALSKMIYPPSE